MLRMKFAAAVAASLLVASIGTATAAETAGPDDTARFLAGMPPSSGSPLVPLTRDRAWQQHAHSFDSAFANVIHQPVAAARVRRQLIKHPHEFLVGQRRSLLKLRRLWKRTVIGLGADR